MQSCSCGKVMFSYVSLSVRGGVSHVTIIYDVSSLCRTHTPSPSPSPIPSRDIGPQDLPGYGRGTLQVAPGGHHWRPVQTCSLQDPPPLFPTSGEARPSVQTGGTHPTGILSFYACELSIIVRNVTIIEIQNIA